VRLGYSQISNPLYLMHKGTVPASHIADNIARNFIMNHLRALAPEPFIDRRGRVRGNWLAIADVMRGRLTPERILSL
jgi:hypothetical protein